MSKKFDTIIVGAGIAGLLTALRLSQKGQKILVVERDKVGSGATAANHGTIHSGAHYMEHFPNIVNSCIEAQYLFSNLFQNANLLSGDSIHVVKRENYTNFENLLKTYQLEHKEVIADNIPELEARILKSSKFVSIKEGIYSSREILEILLSYCLANEVKFILGDMVRGIVVKSNVVSGIYLSSGEQINGKNIVIATGLGTQKILDSFNSHFSKYLKSRLGMMVYLPKSHITRGFVFMEPNNPVLLPAPRNGSLASIFGMVLPPIFEDRNFSIDYEKASLVISGIKSNFSSDLINTDGAKFYVAGKTDYINNDLIVKNLVNPGYNVIDHKLKDRISGLYTLVTGKMTLAFHCSKDVSEMILKDKLDLEIVQNKRLEPLTDMLASEPWA